MPQVQPGQVQPGQDGAPQLYGVADVENSIPFQERLMRLFQPHEYVQIKNIDDEPVYWQYLPSHAEDVQNTPDGMQKIVTRGTPEMWVINPGDVEVLVGASAYMALDAIYKNFMAKTTLKRAGITASFDKENNHVPKNFNFSDGGAQEAFIKKAYLGKANPTFAAAQPAEAIGPGPEELAATAATKAKELTNAGGSKK